VEFINRALSLIYDTRLELRKPSHLVIVGDLRVPRVSVRLESSDPVRLIIDASPRTNSTVSQESNNTLTVKFEADALDVTVPPVQPQGFIQAIRVVESATIVIDLGPRFSSFRAATQPIDTVARLTIDFSPVQADAQPAQPVQAPPASPAPDLSVLGQPITPVRTVAIDPGHGGEDQGVRSANGTTEKDLVLAVARRVKTAIESRLGIRVLLTRDDDRNVSLDGRAAIANNNKADLFISLHANASFRKTMTGASVLYATFSRQTMQAIAPVQGSERLPAFGGGMRDLDLVPWDLAQIRHVDRSGELARILDAQFKDRIPLTAHPVERAPLSVLEACNMPAVAVEMGYLTNPEQEKQMVGAEFQNTFTQAVYDAVLKFRDVLGSGGTH
jgi:N-acetylmuramoyl-L-alanine amidase